MENGNPEERLCEEEEVTQQIPQLQAGTMALKTGLTEVLQELNILKQRDTVLEDRIRSHHSDTEEKILAIRSSLNHFKEDLDAALRQMKQLNCQHIELQRGLGLVQTQMGTELHTRQQRKGSTEDIVCDGHQCSSIQPGFTGLLSGSAHICFTETESPVWRQREEGRDTGRTGRRQRTALELLESERLYVSYLSLLLKANITFNGSEPLHLRDKRPFPSCLRFLIQQHLELLHVLQERVLKSQWHAVMGDVFMRLTGKESDFLDYYVAYLKELPDCLSVVNACSAASLEAAGLFESELGDEETPSLHVLLLQPVRRIPDYLLLLQNLLKHTDGEHPDYYLLLLCIQQFRAFTGQYSHLLQRGEELLLHNRREVKRTAMRQLYKTVDCGVPVDDPTQPRVSRSIAMQHSSQARRSRQKLPEHTQGKTCQNWEHANIPFLPTEVELWPKPSILHSIPETEQETPPPKPLADTRKRPNPGCAQSHILLPPEASSLEGLYEDGNISLLDNGSSGSSGSSVDIAFVHCAGSNSKGVTGHSGCYGQPEEPGIARHRPLQAGQRKSKSLNGLQLESSMVTEQMLQSIGPHSKLERQGSRGLARRRALKLESDSHSEEEQRRDHDKDSGIQSWSEEQRWRSGGEESSHSSFSVRSRKEESKGGFRSSFKKLFKKKSGGDSKDKPAELQSHRDHEVVRTPRVTRLGDLDRGTAV